MDQFQADILPVISLSTGVVLPGMEVTVGLETSEAKAASDAANKGDGRVLLVPKVGNRYASVGTLAALSEVGRMRSGMSAAAVRGLARARIGTGVAGTGDALWVSVERVDEAPASERAKELAREYGAVMESLLEARGASGMVDVLRSMEDPSALADSAGYSPDLSFEQKVELLETIDLEERLVKAVGWMKDVLAQLSLREKIRREVTDGLERSQREFLLRQQLAELRKELGELEGDSAVEEDYREKVEAAALPDKIRDAVMTEVRRLERTPEQSPEHGWIRGWLDTVLEMPWKERSPDHVDLGAARAALDEDHHGLEDVKERIVEHLAVRKLRAERGMEPAGSRGSGAILALVGPPGVGKTSLGESVARSLGRRFVRVALGGTRDEAEIRGHRRTYVGAQPGRIARAIREAGTMNPVMVLDEVDKLGADWRGDPSSALLEVLDPAQNHTFRDNYLEVELDLSDVMFICTANVAETIPPPLLDRLEVIRLDGYTEDDKVAIARSHLLPRLLESHGLLEGDVEVEDEAFRRIVGEYTREAGVRGLERELGRLLRKIVTSVASSERSTPVLVGAEDLSSYLGRQRFFSEPLERTAVPGVATGLAVTGSGGEVLFVEASSMDGNESLEVTGQLGDVMRESSEIALSFVRSHAAELGLGQRSFAGRRFHLHVPAGAVPKDGPSAGVTMVTALVSLLKDRPVRANVGMTGEVTLQGRVLPIGGVKQKVLAARRAGLNEVILPARNAGDLEDVPEAVRKEMTFHTVSDVSEVLSLALEPSLAPALAS